MKIEIEYKSFFFKRKFKTVISDNWNTLSDIFVSNNLNILSLVREVTEIPQDIKIKLLIDLLNLPKKLQKKITVDLLSEKTADNNSLLNCIEFLSKKESVTHFWFKKLNSKIKDIYAPENGIANMTFGEFIYADTYYMAFLKTNDITFAKKMICTLYRELSEISPIATNYVSNIVVFNENSVDYRAKNILINKKTIECILFNYRLLRESIINDSEISNLFSGGDKSDFIDVNSWLNVAKNIRKSFESDSTIMNLNYKYVLMDIIKEIDRNKTK